MSEYHNFLSSWHTNEWHDQGRSNKDNYTDSNISGHPPMECMIKGSGREDLEHNLFYFKIPS